MGSTSEAKIRSLLDAWGDGNDAVSAQVREHFAPDATWEQPGLPTTKGPDEAVDLIKGMDGMGIAAIKVDYVKTSGTDDVVFTERVDHVVMTDGTTSMSIKVVGVTEFRDGKISAWREYFDTGALGQLPDA
jgi:limonene-1,2-epoxide hydrolase